MASEARGSTIAGRWRSVVATPLAVGVTAVALAWLNHIHPEFLLTDDGVRDQLLARDCVELGHCYLIGAPTSVPGVSQGAVWVQLLTAVRLCGGDEATARIVVLALMALSVGTLFLTVWRWLRPSIAFPAAGLFLAALSWDPYPSQLINPSASAFPDALTAAGLLCFGLSQLSRYLVLAAFALGLAINVHVGAVSLAPSLLAVVALWSSRPARELLLAFGVLFATYFLTSRTALLANLDGLASHGRLLPALGGVFATLLLSLAFRPWLRRLSWNARAWCVGFILTAPFAAGLFWLILWQRHAFGLTYLHPILAPAAAMAAALVCVPFELAAAWGAACRWIPTAAAVASFASIVLHSARAQLPPAPESWTLAEATTIADRAMKMGWGYEDLRFHIQGPACRELLVGISVTAPPPLPEAGKNRKHLQVLRATPGRVAPVAAARDMVSLPAGEVAVLREIDSWLDPEALVACRIPVDSARPPVCRPARGRPFDSDKPDRFLFMTRSFPDIHDIDVPPPYVARYEVPLSPVAGQTRDFVLADNDLSGCGWSITRTEGVRADSQLPAHHLRLHSDAGAPGLIVFEKPFGTSACPDIVDRRYPPCVVETPPEETPQAVAEDR